MKRERDRGKGKQMEKLREREILARTKYNSQQANTEMHVWKAHGWGESVYKIQNLQMLSCFLAMGMEPWPVWKSLSHSRVLATLSGRDMI